MYQIVGADGAPGDPVDLSVLKDMAADGRLVPTTVVLDPISGRSAPACEMFVGGELFAADGSAAVATNPVDADAASLSAAEPPTAETPEDPAIVAVAEPAPVAVLPNVSQTPAPPAPITTTPISSSQPAYPSLSTEGIPDLGARFIGILIDSLIGVPLHVLALIPLVGIVMAPVTVGYWLSRDAFFGGQSIGKRVAKTRVVRLDGSPFTWQHSALRNIVYVPILALVIPFFGVPIAHALLGPCLLADLICVLVTQRRIGDYLANTQVVRSE